MQLWCAHVHAHTHLSERGKTFQLSSDPNPNPVPRYASQDPQGRTSEEASSLKKVLLPVSEAGVASDPRGPRLLGLLLRLPCGRGSPTTYPVLLVSLQGSVHELQGDVLILLQPLHDKLFKPPA